MSEDCRLVNFGFDVLTYLLTGYINISKEPFLNLIAQSRIGALNCSYSALFGIDFKHAVEFSRFRCDPVFGLASTRGNSINSTLAFDLSQILGGVLLRAFYCDECFFIQSEFLLETLGD